MPSWSPSLATDHAPALKVSHLEGWRWRWEVPRHDQGLCRDWWSTYIRGLMNQQASIVVVIPKPGVGPSSSPAAVSYLMMSYYHVGVTSSRVCSQPFAARRSGAQGLPELQRPEAQKPTWSNGSALVQYIVSGCGGDDREEERRRQR
jgi:hypothetical protein